MTDTAQGRITLLRAVSAAADEAGTASLIAEFAGHASTRNMAEALRIPFLLIEIANGSMSGDGENPTVDDIASMLAWMEKHSVSLADLKQAFPAPAAERHRKAA